MLVGLRSASFKMVGGAVWLAMVRRMLEPMEPEMEEEKSATSEVEDMRRVA